MSLVVAGTEVFIRVCLSALQGGADVESRLLQLIKVLKQRQGKSCEDSSVVSMVDGQSDEHWRYDSPRRAMLERQKRCSSSFSSPKLSRATPNLTKSSRGKPKLAQVCGQIRSLA